MGQPLTLADASPAAAPICPHFGTCGGCALQHFDADGYAALKRQRVVEALEGARIDCDVQPLVRAWGDGRRRITLHITGGRVGLMAASSHQLVEIAACPILMPALEQRALTLARRLAPLLGDGDLVLTWTDDGIDAAFRGKKRPRPDRLAAIGELPGLARLSGPGGEIWLQARPPRLRVGPAVVSLPPGGFLQATRAGEEALARRVIEATAGSNSVADLFCGIGPFALRLAQRAKVFAADSDRAAVEALAGAVRSTPGLKPVAAKVRNLFNDPLSPDELKGYEAVVIDPPRAGAEAQVRELSRSHIGVVAYASCEPRTFARDAALLIKGGYRLATVTPIDQFAYSTHVELVGVFRR